MPALDLISSAPLAPEIRAIIESAPVPGLQASPQCRQTRAAIEHWLSIGAPTWGDGTGAANAAPLIEAGVWLLAGELERSHAISQAIDSPLAAYWHGVMHRREGDFWNSKYWFRRAGQISVGDQLAAHLAVDRPHCPELYELVAQIRKTSDFSSSLSDWCERALGDKSEYLQDLQRICWCEWQLLFRESLPIRGNSV